MLSNEPKTFFPISMLYIPTVETFKLTYNSKSVLYYVVQCPTQLVVASAISEPQQQASLRHHSNARRPHAPPVSAVRAAVDSSAVLSKHCPNKKLRKKNLVKLIGVIVRTAAV